MISRRKMSQRPQVQEELVPLLRHQMLIIVVEIDLVRVLRGRKKNRFISKIRKLGVRLTFFYRVVARVFTL